MHLLATVEVNTSTSGGRYFKKAAYFLEVRSTSTFYHVSSYPRSTSYQCCTGLMTQLDTK